MAMEEVSLMSSIVVRGLDESVKNQLASQAADEHLAGSGIDLIYRWARLTRVSDSAG